MPDLQNFIKYSLGYIKLTRAQTFAGQQKSAVQLAADTFDLKGLLNGDLDGEAGELVNLPLFYELDPKKVKKEQKEQYEQEKSLAAKVEDIYSKYRNDQFTKQVNCNFGFFELELPIETAPSEDNSEQEEETAPRTKIDRYPLFSLVVKIEKEDKGKYAVYPVDQEVRVNLGMLESVLTEDLYYQLVENVGKMEITGLFSFPLNEMNMFVDVWHRIKEALKFTKAVFDEDSFKLDEVKLALTTRTNYFLAEDLQKLAKLNDEELKNTALASWTNNDDLNVGQEVPGEKDLYFPFLYDKYKLKVLSLLATKSAIVQGPPGTGKSETIANLLCHLAANGKTVLFVSQKSQALKVVKDRLKKLKVKYLFGYIPNPASQQLGEQDEIDGIGPQLASVDSHVERIEHTRQKRNGTLAAAVEVKISAKGAFDRSIENQRLIYQLVQELDALKEYDVNIFDIKSFEAQFTAECRDEISGLKQVILELEQKIRDYEVSEDKRYFDEIFVGIKISGDHASALSFLRDDVSSSAYDRHFNLIRKLNNFRRNLRLGKIREQLPREIIDHVDRFLAQDISRHQALAGIDRVYIHCSHYHNLDSLSGAKEKLEEELNRAGLTFNEFPNVDMLIISNFLEVKEKILRVATIRKELRELHKLDVNPNQLSADINHAEEERRMSVGRYIENIINQRLGRASSEISIRQVVRKLAKAFQKSKRAFKTFDTIRKEPEYFKTVLELIPIWIMELDDASRIVPLEAGLFDYVILDEASQCNVAYTLPVMYRADRAIFVGDSEQMKDSTVMFKSNQSFEELARRYSIPEELQIKATQSAAQSVLDIATLRGFRSIPLRYHYRSPNELIGFSNENFYKPKDKELIALNNNYLTYKDTNRVLVNHFVIPDLSEETSDISNITEAREILKLFQELKGDERYRGKSVGILTFFNAQAACIRKVFEEAGLKEDDGVDGNNFKISIIEGIQGDEKDIIIYSFVIRSPAQKKRYMPLTGKGGDIRGEVNKGRVNVAFSRAKLQVHCFVSMPIHDFPKDIWIKEYLEYVEERGEIDFYSTDLKPFDSYFEEEFYTLIKEQFGKKFIVQNQVESCGFKIDFVVTNPKTGKKIAVECDGPTHFGDELDEECGIYVESDEERQGVLEAAGWRFYRLKYSDWIKESCDRKVFTQELEQLLQ